jgi:hypothetical protein
VRHYFTTWCILSSALTAITLTLCVLLTASNDHAHCVHVDNTNNANLLNWVTHKTQCDQGKFEEAAPVYARVLGIARRTLPQQHPRIAAATNNFGLVLKQVRRVTSTAL